jgi:hypothetical protein
MSFQKALFATMLSITLAVILYSPASEAGCSKILEKIFSRFFEPEMPTKTVDLSHLKIGETYYVVGSVTPAQERFTIWFTDMDYMKLEVGGDTPSELKAKIKGKKGGLSWGAFGIPPAAHVEPLSPQWAAHAKAIEEGVKKVYPKMHSLIIAHQGRYAEGVLFEIIPQSKTEKGFIKGAFAGGGVGFSDQSVGLRSTGYFMEGTGALEYLPFLKDAKIIRTDLPYEAKGEALLTELLHPQETPTQSPQVLKAFEDKIIELLQTELSAVP